ncbi:MAG: DegT/DnrJ/EryC1/StrS family aminotransferase [Blastocatellia bacterium]
MTNFLPFFLPDLTAADLFQTRHQADGNPGQSELSTSRTLTQLLERQFTILLQESEKSRHETTSIPLHALAVNSAATGLNLALEAIGVGPHDEIITSPYSGTSTAGVIRHLGARPTFVDIDPATLNIDHSRIERAITPRTKAILTNHIGGLACEMSPILEIARRHGLKVVEDATQALTSSSGGTLVGALGSDATIFSLNAIGNAAGADSTSECAILVTPDPEVANRCRITRRQGANQTAHNSYGTGSLSSKQETTSPSGLLGFKYNLPDLAASAGLEQVRRSWEYRERRAHLAARYDEGLRDLPIILPAPAADGDLHAWQRYIIRLDHSIRITRDDFIKEMASRGIGCGIHFVPLHLHPYWSETYRLQPHHFPSSWHAYERVVSLPIYSRMTDDDLSRVVRAVEGVVKSALSRPRHSLIFSTAVAG